MPDDCVHHWVIATPDGGAEVPGECRHCGERRHFVAGMWETSDSKASRERFERARENGHERNRKVSHA